MTEKKKIISYLESQKEHIEYADGGSALTLAWRQNLQDYLRQLFGEGDVVKQLYRVTFGNLDDRKYAEFIINDAIKKVNIGSYNQRDKKNFLRKLSDNWLIAIMSLIAGVILPTVYSIGFWFGTHTNTINQNSKPDTEQKAKTK